MNSNVEILEIKTDETNFFYEYLLLKKPVMELILSRINNKKVSLAPKLLKVYSILLIYNNIYKDNPNKWDIIFGNDVREKIKAYLKISDLQLNTYISILRGIKLLEKKTINEQFIIYPANGYELTFKFNINGHEK